MWHFKRDVWCSCDAGSENSEFHHMHGMLTCLPLAACASNGIATLMYISPSGIPGALVPATS